MEFLQFFILGALFTLFTLGYAYLSTRVSMPLWAWIAQISGGLLVLFGLAWAGSSYHEDIPQSGSLALVAFCLTGFFTNLLVWKRFIPKGFKF